MLDVDVLSLCTGDYANYLFNAEVMQVISCDSIC
jgi:hypothetical protein